MTVISKNIQQALFSDTENPSKTEKKPKTYKTIYFRALKTDHIHTETEQKDSISLPSTAWCLQKVCRVQQTSNHDRKAAFSGSTAL